MSIERIDKYHIRVDGCEVLATPSQEATIRGLTPEQRRDFLAIMGRTHDTEGAS